MKKSLLILLVFISCCCTAQKLKVGTVIILTNEAWNCGGYTPLKAIVVKIKGLLLVKFNFSYPGNKGYQYYTIKQSLVDWRNDGTKIIGIK